MATMAEVIDRAANEWFKKPAPVDGSTFGTHIAAAVAAHLASDDVVNLATEALIRETYRQIGDAPDSDTIQRIRERAMRAAISAALGEHEGEA